MAALSLPGVHAYDANECAPHTHRLTKLLACMRLCKRERPASDWCCLSVLLCFSLSTDTLPRLAVTTAVRDVCNCCHDRQSRNDTTGRRLLSWRRPRPRSSAGHCRRPPCPTTSSALWPRARILQRAPYSPGAVVQQPPRRGKFIGLLRRSKKSMPRR